MSVSRIRRHTRLPCGFSQNDRIRSSNPRHLESGCYKRIAQVAMAKSLALFKVGVLFHCLFKTSVSRNRDDCGHHPLSVVAYVDGVYLIAIPRSMEGAP